MNDLSVIPNFESDLDFEAIKSRFIKAARSILFGHKLIYGSHKWPITALELYLYRPDVWPDISAHGYKQGPTSEQYRSGTWHVHGYVRSPKKRPPLRSGIDITAGSQGICAGLLIAALDDKDGSATALTTILRVGSESIFENTRWSCDEKAALAKIDKTRIDSGPLKLESCPTRDGTLFIGRRKGLSNAIPEPFRTCELRLASKTWKTTPWMKEHVEVAKIIDK